ncbi:Matrix Gla protein [Liparis tanakae]|uniref:Matrix Gla protein n=1 Tax=Liparis tanakae TaxID=230148 RepID=A0A4Z2G400_9TELE|nr:Matrix Gla protein [Liparis tanakae]
MKGWGEERVRTSSPTNPRMRSLLQCLALCAAVSFCVGYDVFVAPSRANSFITPQRGSAYSPGRGAGLNYYRFTRCRTRPQTCARSTNTTPYICPKPRRQAHTIEKKP